jgi:hypothetical protein
MTITPELAVSQESTEGPQSAGAHAAPPDAPTRRPAPARRGRSLLVLGLVVLALVAAGTATGVTLHRHDRRAAGPVANQRPGKLPVAVASAPPTVVAADGSTVTCPTGAVPAIALSGGVFTPRLVDGQLIGKGRYHIRLTGFVRNETSATIVIESITVFIDDQRWAATVTVVPGLDAQSSADVVIEGTYQSPRAGTPSIHTNLNWHWRSADLLPCGDAGLIEDD